MTIFICNNSTIKDRTWKKEDAGTIDDATYDEYNMCYRGLVSYKSKKDYKNGKFNFNYRPMTELEDKKQELLEKFPVVDLPFYPQKREFFIKPYISFDKRVLFDLSINHQETSLCLFGLSIGIKIGMEKEAEYDMEYIKENTKNKGK